MKQFLITLLLISTGFLYAQSTEGLNISRNGNDYVISFTLPDYQETYTTMNGKEFTQITVPDYGVTADIGRPALPQVSFNLMITGNSTKPTAKILHADQRTTTVKSDILPFQAPYRRDLPLNQRPFNFDRAFYTSNGDDKKPVVTISDPFIVNGETGVTVTIYPFNYLPAGKKLVISRNIEIQLSLQSGVTESGVHSEAYDSFFDMFFLNYRSSGFRSANNYLIITAPEFEAGLATFVTHKSVSGFNVNLFTTATTGTTTTAIKTFIQQRYDNPATKPDFILLVGDVDKIPAWTGAGEGSPKTDLNYVLLQGTDYYADAFIGRFSITNATELNNIINKTLYTENNIATFQKKNVWMASTDNYSITEGTHNYVINTYFDPAGYTNQKLYTQTYNATTAQLIAALNENRIFAVYSGHGSETSWADGPVLSQANVRSLTNTVFPFVYSFACVTGSYHLAECFGETWIRTTNGGTSFYGSSVNSYWDEDDILERKLFKSMFEDNLTKVTPMFDMGKYLTVLHFAQTPAPGNTMLRYIEMYNLMGDPSLETKRVIPPDTTAPNQITNLAAGNPTSNSLTLNWTAPYDSTFGGINTYDIRYATTPIVNDNDFNAATQILFGGHNDTLGTPKTYTITNLSPGTTYHFAAKAMDMWGNKSVKSNSVSAATWGAPMVLVNPGTISHVMTNQQEIIDTIIIKNTAGHNSTLDYSIVFDDNTYPSKSISYSIVPLKTDLPEGDSKENPRQQFGQSVKGSGGPDLFGYEWIDSDAPSGPQYVWEDISATGTQVTQWVPSGTFSATDEGYAGPISLGFNFKFYGQVKTQIYISTNGFLTFAPISYSAYSNAQIPNTANPNEIICPNWDDLDAKAPGTVHYKLDGNKMIFQWTNYQRYSGTASYTWQVVLYSSGKIMYYYKNMTGTINSSTVGIENAQGNDGLQIAYDASYIKNNLAVKLEADPEWMISNSPMSGTLNQNNTAAVILRIVTEDFPIGNYGMNMKVSSNCAVNPLVTVPISLTLAPIPVELSSFEASTSLNDVILNWETATETNNMGFAVERKVKSSESWTAVSFLNGKGTTTEKNTYTFRDTDVKPGTYTYRIKQTDFDGTVSFSKELEIEVGIPDEFALYQNYPNPFNPSTTIAYAIPALDGVKAHSVVLKVYDVIGNEVSTLFEGEREPGIYKTELNFSNFSSGVYFYKLTSGKFSAIKKFVLMK